MAKRIQQYERLDEILKYLIREIYSKENFNDVGIKYGAEISTTFEEDSIRTTIEFEFVNLKEMGDK